jgi:hypothetical protein
MRWNFIRSETISVEFIRMNVDGKMPLINLTLNIICNVLVFWTWFKIFDNEFDAVFLGLLVLPLFFITVYYLILLIWTAEFTLKVKGCN